MKIVKLGENVKSPLPAYIYLYHTHIHTLYHTTYICIILIHIYTYIHNTYIINNTIHTHTTHTYIHIHLNMHRAHTYMYAHTKICTYTHIYLYKHIIHIIHCLFKMYILYFAILFLQIYFLGNKQLCIFSRMLVSLYVLDFLLKQKSNWTKHLILGILFHTSSFPT